MTHIPDHVVAAQERIMATPEQPISEIGGVRMLVSSDIHQQGESDAESDIDLESNGSDIDPAARSGMHGITVSLIVSFDLTRPDLIERPNLRRLEFDLGSESLFLNFANPFTRGNSRKGAAVGVSRPVLNVIANIVKDINNANISFIGREDDVASHVEDICARFNESFAGCLPAAPTQIIYEESDDLPGVLMRDLIDVNTWFVTDQREDGLGLMYNIYINLIVNAMPAFESDEPHRFIVQGLNSVVSFMNNAGIELDPYATLRFDSNLLDQQIINDLFAFFTDDENGGWRAVGRRSVELGQSTHSNFVQSDQSSLLFGEVSDLLLFYYPSEVEGEEAEGQDAVEE